MTVSKKSSLNVLFIEDNTGYANIMKRRLLDETNPSFHVEHVDKLQPALDRLGTGSTDVILLDLTLPDSKGLDTLIRVHTQAPEIPVVVSTGLDDETTGIQAVRQGAEDYLVKGRINGKVISKVLQYAIERHRQRSELKNLSLTDELTSLFNRRGFIVLADQQIKLACRTKFGFLLFFIDLDDFKPINDTYGHAKGDQVLIDFAKVLKATFRNSDIIARIGGDEFAVLAVKPHESTSDVLLSRLRDNLKRYQTDSNHPLTLSASIGVEKFDPYNPCTIDELMAHADKRMYRDKHGKHLPGAAKNGNAGSRYPKAG